MSTTDLAAVLGVKPETVRRMRWDGSGPKFIRRGKRALYDPRDVREWLDAQKQTYASEGRPSTNPGISRVTREG